MTASAQNEENIIPIEERLKVYALIQGNLDAVNTQSDLGPGFEGIHARAGITSKRGIVSGKLEVEFNGNDSYVQKTTTDPVDNKEQRSQSTNNSVTLRQAQINLNFSHKDTEDLSWKTVFSAGGIRLGKAAYAAPDIANTPSGFGRQDGFYLEEQILVKNIDTELRLGGGIFNTLAGSIPGSSFTFWNQNGGLTVSNPWLDGAINKDKAYLGRGQIEYHFNRQSKLQWIGYYGMQNNAPYAIDDNNGDISQTRNVSHLETSLAWRNPEVFGRQGLVTANGLGFWYERESNGQTHILQDDSYIPGLLNDATTAQLFGIGVAGDTGLFYGDIFEKSDRLTYGLSYTYVRAVYEDAAYAPNNSAHQVALSFGYGVYSFEAALNVEASSAQEKTFKTEDGNPTHSEIRSYVTLLYLL